MKKRKLKKWVRYTLYVIMGICLTLLFCSSYKNYINKAHECDRAYGTTCSIYDIQQYVARR